MSGNKISKEEVMRISVEGILKQGVPSAIFNEHGELSALYRSNDGCKCGIGHLIKDKDYNPSIENLTCNHPSIIKVLPEISELNSINSVEVFYWNLQRTHDDAAVQSMRERKIFISVYRMNIEAFCEWAKIPFPKDLFDAKLGTRPKV